MGYNVNYKLEVDVGETGGDRDVILFKLRKTSERIAFSLDDEFSPYHERGKPKREVVFGNGEGQWDTYQDDMKSFSAKWPGVLFTITADGEEQGDLEVAYFRDGKMQLERQQPWEPAPFDPAKLK